MKKSALKTLLFILPYILTTLANTFFRVIDQSISNSIGETALIVFSTFTTLNWAIYIRSSVYRHRAKLYT